MHIKLVNVRITNESPQASLRARYRVRPESMGFGQSGAKSGAKVWSKSGPKELTMTFRTPLQ